MTIPDNIIRCALQLADGDADSFVTVEKWLYDNIYTVPDEPNSFRVTIVGIEVVDERGASTVFSPTTGEPESFYDYLPMGEKFLAVEVR